ncbi:hypothetical protein H5410_027314 [Solanum commersonii]|uniref:Uncharacterized protein n=1 Tax=Solanum commersonii TaxID=4109 RepID=A0A9J5Z437_SOLCO|nr:hypothetical protein H5410_027314 [Solanum commersonii]
MQLQMDHAVSNPNGKIWLFWSNEVTGQVLEKHDQYITVTIQHTILPNKYMMPFIYAKCKEYMRRPLWYSFYIVGLKMGLFLTQFSSLGNRSLLVILCGNYI